MVGVYAPGLPVAHLAALGLHALQHRGQESAGIAVSDGSQLTLHKRLGLVGQVFDEETLARLEADQDGSAPRATPLAWRSGIPATARPARTASRTCSRSTPRASWAS